jgi:F0F1-type ATP synthase alpha subunit
MPVDAVGRVEHEMLRTVRDQHANVLEEIGAAKELKPETEKSLVEALDKFAKTFTV